MGKAGCEIAIEGEMPRRTGLGKREVALAAAAFAASAARLARRPFRSVAVVLQDDASSDAAHRAIMGVCGATDVITQRYDPIPPEPDGVYGELYVNADRAIAAAPRRTGWTPAKELLLYVAHGMDHLAGSDDDTPARRAAMRRRELRWLRDALKDEGGRT